MVDLVVDVRERRDSWFGLGVGYSSRDLARLSGEWGNRNIGGEGRMLTLQNQVGLSLDTLFVRGKVPPVGENLSQLSWREPWFLGTRTPLQLTGYFSFQKQKTFDQSIWGLKSTARRDLSTTARVFLTFENRWVTTTDPTLVRQRYTTRLLDLRHERDTRDDFFEPHRGALQQSLAEYSGGFLGGQSTFGKFSAGSAWYSPLGERIVIAWRAQAGLIEPMRSDLGGTRGGFAGGAQGAVRRPFLRRRRLHRARLSRAAARPDDEGGRKDAATWRARDVRRERRASRAALLALLRGVLRGQRQRVGGSPGVQDLALRGRVRRRRPLRPRREVRRRDRASRAHAGGAAARGLRAEDRAKPPFVRRGRMKST